MMQVILDPPGDPEANMMADQEISKQSVLLQPPHPILRIYRWKRPAISLGRRQTLDELPPTLQGMGLSLVRRATGGGAVVHRADELTYALGFPRHLLPRGLAFRQLPKLFHQQLGEILVHRGWFSAQDISISGSDPAGPAPLCFEAPACGDLIYRGKKLAGMAIRVWHDRILLQGSLQGFSLQQDQLTDGVVLAFYRVFSEEIVRKERFELSRVAPLASETSAYASSATSAKIA